MSDSGIAIIGFDERTRGDRKVLKQASEQVMHATLQFFVNFWQI
jgi:hypothetical protein